MVQFSGFASIPYVFRYRWPLRAGFPHSEISGYNTCLSVPPSLSQITTSFIASNCLGIHHMRLFTWSYNLNTPLKCAYQTTTFVVQIKSYTYRITLEIFRIVYLVLLTNLISFFTLFITNVVWVPLTMNKEQPQICGCLYRLLYHFLLF